MCMRHMTDTVQCPALTSQSRHQSQTLLILSVNRIKAARVTGSTTKLESGKKAPKGRWRREKKEKKKGCFSEAKDGRAVFRRFAMPAPSVLTAVISNRLLRGSFSGLCFSLSVYLTICLPLFVFFNTTLSAMPSLSVCVQDCMRMCLCMYICTC